MPATLKRMMRHRSINTTMTFYKDQTADEVAEAAWQAWEQNAQRGGTSGGTSRISGPETSSARRVSGDGPRT